MRVERIPPENAAEVPMPTYTVEGPLEERKLVTTEWGEAWAEVDTYVLTDEITHWPHVVHPDDYPTQYREIG